MDGKDIYMEFFRQADKDGNNYLDIQELIDMMRSKGYKGNDGDIKVSSDFWEILSW